MSSRLQPYAIQVRGLGSSALSSPEEQLANVQVVPERAMAMLALTAFHDVMKVRPYNCIGSRSHSHRHTSTT